MRKCDVCGEEKGLVSVGSAILCRIHHEEVRRTIDELRADGKPVSAINIALTMKKTKGPRSIYVDDKIADKAMETWNGSFSSLVTHLLDQFVGSKQEKER